MDKYCIVALSPVYRLIVALPMSATAGSKLLYLVTPSNQVVIRSRYLHPVVTSASNNIGVTDPGYGDVGDFYGPVECFFFSRRRRDTTTQRLLLL